MGVVLGSSLQLSLFAETPEIGTPKPKDFIIAPLTIRNGLDVLHLRSKDTVGGPISEIGIDYTSREVEVGGGLMLQTDPQYRERGIATYMVAASLAYITGNENFENRPVVFRIYPDEPGEGVPFVSRQCILERILATIGMKERIDYKGYLEMNIFKPKNERPYVIELNSHTLSRGLSYIKMVLAMNDFKPYKRFIN